MGRLDEKIAIVTGAAMGMGEGIARVMAKHGARVALWDISEQVHETTESIRSGGHVATSHKVDVRSFEQCKEAAADVITKFGKVDVLCNNAGVHTIMPFLNMCDADRDFVLDTNIKGVWNCTKAVLPYMKQNRYGRIVIMSSTTGSMVANLGETAYAVSKGAVWGFTKALALEVVGDNITVNAICPGFIRTPMAVNGVKKFSDDPDSVLDMIASTIPMGRLGNILEVGELAAFLASDESSYITGTQVIIDGGNSLPDLAML